jgi:hypothetical protein
MVSIRAARTVSLGAVVGAPLLSALLDCRAWWNPPLLAVHPGAVGGEPWQ